MKIKISISAGKTIVLDKDDLRDLKNDLEEFATTLYTPDLIDILRTANESYHNTGTSQLSDKQYDRLLDELRTRKPNHALLKKAGAVVPKGRTKVKLPYPLFSLDKIKPGEKSFEQWKATHKGPLLISDKEDGLSLEVIYEGGIPKKAYTRGNGIVGQDVSHLIPDLEIPLSIPYKELFAVRMEAIMSEADFAKHYAKSQEGKGYENSRNLVAGVINTLNKRHPALTHIHTISYEIIEPRMKPSTALDKLKGYGFHIVPYKLVNTLDEAVLTAYLKQRKSKSQVNIDGLVIEQDIKTTRPTLGNPSYAVAFKTEMEGDIVYAEVVEIIWQKSKFGKLKPVLLIKTPDSSTLKRLKL